MRRRATLVIWVPVSERANLLDWRDTLPPRRSAPETAISAFGCWQMCRASRISPAPELHTHGGNSGDAAAEPAEEVTVFTVKRGRVFFGRPDRNVDNLIAG